MRVAIIGAGAAGCFCALLMKREHPEWSVEIIEGGARPLAKVAITGGGRCNLTNSFAEVRSLKDVYPRGERLMKRALRQFSHTDCMDWWRREGVALVTQDDQCVFPASQDAMQIVNTLLLGLRRAGVNIHTHCRVTSIESIGAIANEPPQYLVSWGNTSKSYDRVVVTTGGSPKANGLLFLQPLALDMEQPCPSLFSFNIDDPIRQLMGQVVNDVTTSLTGTKLKGHGPLLITHWGMSGPAILKLSSHAARHLADCDYKAQLSVNWLDTADEAEAHRLIDGFIASSPQRQVTNAWPQVLPSRLWNYLIQKCGIDPQRRYAELGSKQRNRLASTLINDLYPIAGQSRHKEEFVTCGGVALSNIDLNTLECKRHPGLYFAGEVLDVDAVTGGFNLQAAWSMAFVCAHSIKE